MPTPADAARLLAAITVATEHREQARIEQLTAIRTAVDAGLPITHIARAANLSREHIYRLTRNT